MPASTVTAVAAPALTPLARSCRMANASETAEPPGTLTEMAVRARVTSVERRSVIVPPKRPHQITLLLGEGDEGRDLGHRGEQQPPAVGQCERVHHVAGVQQRTAVQHDGDGEGADPECCHDVPRFDPHQGILPRRM